MTKRLEPASCAPGPYSSHYINEGRLPAAGLEPLTGGPAAPLPATWSRELPERYGMPLLELLVVDPEYVFVSWEISDQQLADARSALGAGFESRRLVARFLVGAPSLVEPQRLLTERELYGETGRWFVRLDSPGEQVSCELCFKAGGTDYALRAAGPVSIPRVRVIESDRFEELTVAYARSADGRLLLLEAARSTGDASRISLPGPNEPPEIGAGPSKAAGASLSLYGSHTLAGRSGRPGGDDV